MIARRKRQDMIYIVRTRGRAGCAQDNVGLDYPCEANALKMCLRIVSGSLLLDVVRADSLYVRCKAQ